MNHNYNIEVGKKINQYRKALKMSMKTLGKKVNLHESTVSRYEKGEIQSLDIEKIKDFAKALDIPITYLLSWTEFEETINMDLYNTIVTMRHDKNIPIEDLLSKFNIEYSDDAPEKYLSFNTRSVEFNKKWYDRVGEFDWTDAEYDFIIACALFIKETKHRDDHEELMILIFKIMEKLKK